MTCHVTSLIYHVTSLIYLEPKPFVEASLIIRKTEQKNVNHFKLVVTSITVYNIMIVCVQICTCVGAEDGC